MRAGKVYVIGAGPGDPKLLTIRAAELLGISDLIVYDYLVNPEVLVHARQGAELLYAGKQAGQPSLSQSEINRILIEQARLGRTVARLKGGDPFIFGRGGEEAEALTEAGVEWEVVPGITAGIGAAAYAGIPLTHREHASSVAFVTGHQSRPGHRQINWGALAQAADTLVIYMCGETIRDIARELIEHGLSPARPAAIICWGSYSNQQVFSGTLDDLASPADQQNDGGAPEHFASPAIAVIGNVVSLLPKLQWFGDSVCVQALRARPARLDIAFTFETL